MQTKRRTLSRKRPALNHSDPDELLRPADAARLLGLAPRTLEADRGRGRLGIPFVRVSARAVRYRRSALVAWATAREFTSTSQYTERVAAEAR